MENIKELLNTISQLGIKISVKEGKLVLNAPKGALSKNLQDQIANNKTEIIWYLDNVSLKELKPLPREEKIQLSYSQQRLWFLYLLNPESTIYNIPATFSIKGKININAMEKAINEIIKRHESLRTNFYLDNGKAYQIIRNDLNIPLLILEFPDKNTAIEYCKKEINIPFNLNTDSLIKFLLLKITNTDEYIFLMVIHHIIADAWSCGVFANELAILYKTFVENTENNFPDLRIQYIDYAIWQKNIVEDSNQLAYWKNKLKGSTGILNLPTDKKRPEFQTFKGHTINKVISDNLQTQLKNLAKSQSVTLFVLLMSAFQVLLFRYTHQEEILVGFPISGRNHKELENLIGFFVNTLVLKGELSNDLSFIDFLKQIDTSTLEAFSNQDLPFEKLVESLQVKRDTSYTPLFQVMFVMQNIDFALPQFGDLDFKILELENPTAKFDLTLTIKENNKVFSIEYKTDLFNDQMIQRFLDNYETLLESIVANPGLSIGQLNILKNNSLVPLISPFKNIKAKNTIKKDIKLIHHLVENAAIDHPDKIALTFENMDISYQELNQRANKLANKLIKLGVKPEIKVGLYIDISIEMIISLLAILKAGGAYVPLDISLPIERLKFIINDCQPSVIISKIGLNQPDNGLISPDIQNINSKILLLNEEDLVNDSSENPDVDINEDNLAYIIYTSGSTGQPNGVQIAHKNVIRLFESTDKLFDFNSNDIWVLFHSFAFDYSIWEIWGCFYWQSKLLVVSKELTRNPQLFYEKICDEKVTVLSQTPSAFYNFSRQAVKSDFKNSLKYLFLSGEALDIQLLKDWYDKFADNSPKVINSYGITETTVFVTYLEMNKSILQSPVKSPIGYGIDDLSLYILDPNIQPVPYGVSGELYVGGAGLARSYLNRDKLNKLRFIQINGHRLYKSGDQVRELPNGSLEYLGRLDNQVKIRGFRIEIGEIEAVLNSYEHIKESVITLNTNENGKFLTAYIVLDQASPPDQISLIKNFLRKKLNEVMIPSVFVQLDFLPLNNNGKVDKKALPEPLNQRSENNIPYIEPDNTTEFKIVQVFQELLNIDRISLNDNFFDLGAHSLLMVSAHDKLQAVLNINFNLIDMFTYPTIKSLSDFLLNKDKKIIRTKDKKSVNQDSDDIAVIGMAGKFPGAGNIEEFWHNLENGIESIHFFTNEELKAKGISEDTLNNPKYIKANGILNDIEYFDADFWGYSPREAEIIDPQQRLFLECAYNALEHSGYNPNTLDFPVGVFAGTALSRYLLFNLFSNQELVNSIGHFQLLIANDKDYLSTRTAYKLNLKGPAITIQTACSTSLVAIHSACQSILNNECEIALAGGVSIDSQREGYFYQEGTIASSDGHCRAFDQKADGIVGGSGLGIVVLKKLEKAIEDNDSIYAVIKSSAINNDGSQKIGFLAPGMQGQSEVIIEAIEKSGINPEDIRYIETHGTATSIGDPIEIAALNSAYKYFTDKNSYCAIGSVKTNIGHLDMAAGVAGFIKTVQSLRYKKIVPSLHFTKANPKIDFINSPFFVNNQLKDWDIQANSKNENIKPRMAAVSSFGVGGTNAHVILSEYISLKENTLNDNSNQLFVFSAKNLNSLNRMINNFKLFITDENNKSDLPDIVYTLKVGRQAFNYRYTFTANTQEEMINALNKYDSQLINPVNNKSKVVFMFSGLGTQYFKMGIELYNNEAIFKNNFDLCCDILKPQTGFDLKEVIFNESDNIHNPSLMQISLFVLEYSLAKLWLSKGIKPYALIGHSFGEYVSACIAECLTLEEALFLLLIRGKLFETVSGITIAVSASKEKLEPLLNDKVFLSAVNSDHLCLVSGLEVHIEQFQNLLRENRIASTRTGISHATHCQLVEPIIKEFKIVLDQVNWKNPKIPIISNLTGTYFQKDQINSDYWINHTLNTVRFFEGIKTLTNEKDLIFLEIGAGNSLTSILKKNKLNNVFNSISVKEQKENEYKNFLTVLGQLWSFGINIDFNADYLNIQPKPKRIALPTYPFEKKRFWIDRIEKSNSLDDSNTIVSKNSFKINANIDDWFYIHSWKRLEKLDNLKSLKENINKYILFTSNIDSFIRVDPKNIYLIPDDLINFNQLYYKNILTKLESENLFPNKIIYHSDSTNVLFDYKNIISLVQNLGSYSQKIELIVLSQNLYKVLGNENINPEKALLSGLVRVINQEYSNVMSSLIDTDSLNNIQAILKENNKNVISAYRNNYKWIQTFEKISLNYNGNSYIKQNGTYIILGGLGGIGLTIAEFLAQKFKANLILIDKNDYIDNQQVNLSLDKIKIAGSKLLIHNCDITDFDKLSDILENTHNIFGGIDGIIHSAGIAGDKLIYQIDNQKESDVINVKFTGTKNLINLGEKYKIDFLILFSSLNSYLGGMGQSDYSSANAYLDSFLEYYQDKNFKLLSINWGTWANIGMADKMSKNLPDSLKNIAETMTANQGLAVFEKILNSDFNQVMVSPSDFENLILKYEEYSAKNSNIKQKIIELIKNKKLYPRPSLMNPYIEPQTELEKNVSEIWQNTLGIEQVGLNDNFFELGGDSLLLAGIKIQLEDKLDYELPMSIMFHSSTVKESANYIEQNHHEKDHLLVKLKTTGDKTPFYCVHAISGTVFPFSYLASNFASDRPFYGLQAKGLTDNQLPLTDIKEMAALYIKSIKSIQSSGPYNIGGWSFGALIALEIAQQLKENGDLVENLVIIDMQAPLDNYDSLKTLINEDDLKNRFLEDMNGLFTETIDFNNPDIKNLYEIFSANIKASSNYKGEKYNGNITLFRADNGMFKEAEDYSLGWDKISDDLKVVNIEGDHYSILKSANLKIKL